MSTRNSGDAPGDATHAAHDSNNPAPEAGMSRDVINIGLNLFKEGIKGYTEHEQDLLEWLWGYAYDILGGSKSELCREMNLDYDLIYKIFTGRHEGSLEPFCEIIRGMKKRSEKQMPLVSTIVTKRIIEALDYARDYCAFVAIKGPTGRGKTHASLYWARNNNHGRTRYIRIPSGCTRRTLVTLLCQNAGIGVNGMKTGAMEFRLYKAFTARNVIIIDEAGHLLPRAGTGTSAIEFLRDLHDLCGCGVALVFTDVYLDEMRNGRLAAYFEQFIGRIKFEITIPNEVRRDEVAAVVNAFNPSAPKKMVDLALELARRRDGKLRTLFEDLKRAKDWALTQKRAVPSTEDLQMAAKWRLSGGVWPEE
jgi:DNA transposition AAA+ family ATPase